MLTMDEQNYLTALREIEGRSLREIAAHTGYHFNTVKKYCRQGRLEHGVSPKKAKSKRARPIKTSNR